MLSQIRHWDGVVLRWIADHLRTPLLNGLMCAYTTLGDHGAFFIVLSLLCLMFRSSRRVGAAGLSALALGAVVTNLTLKPLVARSRPWLVLEGFEVLMHSSDPYSFPSGHTCAAFAFCVAVAAMVPHGWVKLVAVVAAVLMGYTRLHVGVHFPSDVLMGAVVGICCGLVAARMWR